MEKKTPFRELSRKAKAQYIWDYYRIPIIAVIIVLIIVIVEVRSFLSRKETIMEAVFVNCPTAMNEDSGEKLSDSLDQFMEDNGFDPSKQTVSADTSVFITGDGSTGTDVQSTIALDVRVGGGSVNILFAPDDTFEQLAAKYYFIDLSKELDADLLDQYKDSLVYVTDDDTGETYPVGIKITETDNEWLASSETYSHCTFGLCNSSDYEENTKQFVSYILK